MTKYSHDFKYKIETEREKERKRKRERGREKAKHGQAVYFTFSRGIFRTLSNI